MSDQTEIQEKLKATHGHSHHTAGAALPERTARATEISQFHEKQAREEAIRVKAYELWERRGRTHGMDQRDWFEAMEIIFRPGADLFS